MSVSIVTGDAMVAAVARASSVQLSAYVLQRGSPVVRALEAAADRGARVAVRFDGQPYAGPHPSGDPGDANRAVSRELRAHGVNVRVAADGDLAMHMKAALVDGVAYLDDRNWPAGGRDTIVATNDADDVAVVASALSGVPMSDAHLATEKRAALGLEADAIERGSGDRVDVESESFGYSAISKALYARARAGAHVRLLVAEREFLQGSPTERASIRRLAGAGVEIRVASSDEKVCVAGDRAWIGSANATFESTPTLDWGLTSRNPTVVSGASAAFERNWSRGTRVELRAEQVD